MTGPVFIPSLHVAVVHFPIALLAAGVLIEVASFLFPRSSLRLAGRWMILLGAMAGVPVSLCGFHAYRQLLAADNPSASEGWHAMRAGSHLPASASVFMDQHIVVQSAASIAAIVLVTIWISSSDRFRKSMHAIFLLLLIVVMGMVGRGSWLAGEAIYRHQLPVSVKTTDDAENKSTEPTTRQSAEALLHAAEEKLPPMELHTFLAGLAMSLGLVSVGLGYRQINGYVPVAPADENTSRTDPLNMIRSINPDAMMVENPTPPAARFWLLTALLVIAAALSGWWYLASDSDAFATARRQSQPVYKVLWEMVRPATDQRLPRRFAHVAAGGLFVVLPIVLAICTRFLPRRKWILSFFSLLLVLVISFQIWLGLLLMFDTTEGKITRINPPTTAPTTQAIMD